MLHLEVVNVGHLTYSLAIKREHIAVIFLFPPFVIVFTLINAALYSWDHFFSIYPYIYREIAQKKCKNMPMYSKKRNHHCYDRPL